MFETIQEGTSGRIRDQILQKSILGERRADRRVIFLIMIQIKIIACLTISILLSPAISLGMEAECRGRDDKGQSVSMKIMAGNSGFSMSTTGTSLVTDSTLLSNPNGELHFDPTKVIPSSDQTFLTYLWRREGAIQSMTFTASINMNGSGTLFRYIKRNSDGWTVLNDSVIVQCTLRQPKLSSERIDPNPTTGLLFPKKYQALWDKYFGQINNLPRPDYAEGRLSGFLAHNDNYSECFQELGFFYYRMPTYRKMIADIDEPGIGENQREQIQRNLVATGEAFNQYLKDIYQDPLRRSCFSFAAKAYLLESISTLLIRNIRSQPFGQNRKFSGQELAMLSIFILNAFPDKVHVLTPDARMRSSCPFQKTIMTKGKEQYAILAGYNCRKSEVFIDPFQTPLNLAAVFFHELDHLLRDKLGPQNPFSDLTSYILLDESLAAVTAAYYQKTLGSFSHGDYIDQKSPRRISPEDAGFSLFEKNGVFSNLYDQNQSNLISRGLLGFLTALFFESNRPEFASEAARTIINEISNVYFDRDVTSAELISLAPEVVLRWSRKSDHANQEALFSPLGILERQLELVISDQARGLMEFDLNNTVALVDSVNGQKYTTNLANILDLLQLIEEKINGPASQACEIFEQASQSHDGLRGYLGKSPNDSCKPNGHGVIPNGHNVIPSGVIRFCIQPTNSF